jgi:hypothetical protein
VFLCVFSLTVAPKGRLRRTGAATLSSLPWVAQVVGGQEPMVLADDVSFIVLAWIMLMNVLVSVLVKVPAIRCREDPPGLPHLPDGGRGGVGGAGACVQGGGGAGVGGGAGGGRGRWAGGGGRGDVGGRGRGVSPARPTAGSAGPAPAQ